MNIKKHITGFVYVLCVRQLLHRSHLGFLRWYKVVSQCLHGKLHSIPEFVAEVTVTQNAVDIQVDVPTWETKTRISDDISQKKKKSNKSKKKSEMSSPWLV